MRARRNVAVVMLAVAPESMKRVEAIFDEYIKAARGAGPEAAPGGG